MCLIKDRENETCAHAWCARAKKLPHYHVSMPDLLADIEYTHFKKTELSIPREFEHKVKYLKHRVFIKPFNEQTGKLFDGHFVKHPAGIWPDGRELFERSEVAFEWMEKDNDVDEFAVYIGN